MQATLSHYRILEQIGAGGMGVVYRAHDERLDRDVALKVLPFGALADDSARKRFRKEALALSKLNHPNIATVHDFDTQEETDFLVEELIPGLSLSEMLISGPLPELEIINLGSQLCEGLAAAHEHGIIHRDLKPGNIRVTPDARLKILDFGLAKILRTAATSDTDATASLTETQQVSGTVPYMAPEQLLNEKLNARTDIWAAGCVLYEMATSRRPFLGSGPALIDAILHQQPAAPSKLNRNLSPGLEAIILKCLDKDPALRYASARDVAVDLHRLRTGTVTEALSARRRTTVLKLVAAVVVVVAIAGAVTWFIHHRRTPAASTIRSIAVLPLANLSGDPQQEYFADGMTEALITDLSKISALKVISRTSVMQYKGVKKPLREIAHELGVDGIIEGSVQKSGDRVRITAQLIHASTDTHLWAESYNQDLSDVLSLQSEVARAVAREIRVAITPAEQQQLAWARSVNPLAHEEFLKGRFILYNTYLTEEEIMNAIAHYRQAIAIDPSYAPAYAGLADANIWLVDETFRAPSKGIPRAREAVEKALALDDTLPEAHALYAHIKTFYEWDWEGAEREFRRALQLNPNNVYVLDVYSWYLCSQGRFDEALTANARMIELDPLTWRWKVGRGNLYWHARRPEEGIRQLQSVLEVNPVARQFPTVYRILSGSYAVSGKHAEAAQACDRALELTKEGDNPAVLGTCGWVFGLAGQQDKARKMLAQIHAISGKHWVDPVWVGGIYQGLGDYERAMDWNEKGYADRSPLLLLMKRAPGWDALRGNPRFQALLHRIPFPED